MTPRGKSESPERQKIVSGQAEKSLLCLYTKAKSDRE